MTTRTSLFAALYASVLAATMLTSTAMAQDGPAHVTARGAGRDLLSLHVRESGAWRMLCIAPCDVEVSPGVTTLGVARGGGDPVAASVVDVGDDLHLRIRYDDRSGLRVMGVITMLASLAVGIGFGMGGLDVGRAAQGEGVALGAIGIAAAASGAIGGFALLLHRDAAGISFE